MRRARAAARGVKKDAAHLVVSQRGFSYYLTKSHLD
jgi:hypothetical protein